MEAVDKYVPQPDRARRPALPDADRRYLLDLRPRHGGDGPHRARQGEGGRGREIVGFRETRKTVCTGVEMFKKQLDEGLAGDNAGILLRGIPKEDVERGMVLAKPARSRRTPLQGRGVRAEQGRGRPSHAVLQGLPAAVLLPHDGRDGRGGVAGRRGDGDAGRQRGAEIELITPVAMEKGLRFAIREGGRTVGAGTISEIIK
jgi:elongation factor Tu